MALDFESYSIRMFIDDREFGPLSATDVNVDPDRQIVATKYQGEKTPTLTSQNNGINISMTLERRRGGASPEDAFNLYQQGQDRDDGTGRTEIVVAKSVDGIQVEAHRYLGVQWTLSEAASSGQNTRYQFRGQAERSVVL